MSKGKLSLLVTSTYVIILFTIVLWKQCLLEKCYYDVKELLESKYNITVLVYGNIYVLFLEYIH